MKRKDPVPDLLKRMRKTQKVVEKITFIYCEERAHERHSA